MIKKVFTLKKVVGFLTCVLALAVVVQGLTSAAHAIGSNVKKIKGLWKSN
jgi:hypothetical protein